MKRLLFFSKQLASINNLKSHKSLQFQSLFFRSDKYDRYKKVRPSQNANKNIRQQNKQQNNTIRQQNQSKQQQSNDPEQQNKEKNKTNIRLSGPKLLTKAIKQGSTNIIPFYVNNILNKTNPSAQSLKTKILDEQPKKQNQKIQIQINQKGQIKNNSQLNQKEQSKNHVHIKIQIKNNFDKDDTNEKTKPKSKTKIITSSQYKKDLMKNYKVIQALKTSNRLNAQLEKQNIQDKVYKFLGLKQILQKLQNDPEYKKNLQKLKKDPSFKKKDKSYFMPWLIFGILIFIQIYNKYTRQNQEIKFQKNQDGKNSKNIINLQEHQIFNKLTSIQSITFKELNTNSMRKHMMEIKYKSNKQKNNFQMLFNQVASLFTHQNIFDHVDRFYTFQNPNCLLSGLEKAQQNISKENWIQVFIKPKFYTIFDAIKDTLFLMTPFIGVGITYWIFKKMNPDSILSGMTSSRKSMKVESVKDIKVRFKDVAGMESAKKQITQFVDFLKKNDKYTEMGAKIPKGALLTGPPGTGKTMLAKACAGQAGTSFFYVSGSEFVQMFVGLGSSRVRQLFAKARQQAPSIIFIDEIDAIGKKRQTSRNQQKDSTLNQLLVQMDGFSSNQTVIVLAATNRKDVLDSALTRPGRFDRMVQVNLPDIKARQQIFMVHLTPLKINPQKNLNDIAKRLSELSPGFSGADIANLCNEAAIIATRKQRVYIQDADFQQASERIVAGYIKKGSSTAKTKKRVAYHEAGHAVCGWYLKGGDPLVKLTIIPRSKGALGYAQYLPKNSYIKTKTQLIDQVAIMLGGTTSEQLFFGDMSSGASDDLQKVYQLTRRMITQFGMGNQTYNMTLDQERYVKKQSQKLCNLMDEQIMQIIEQASKRAKQILLQKKQIVDNLASELLQKQTINNEDIIRIMGNRPIFA